MDTQEGVATSCPELFVPSPWGNTGGRGGLGPAVEPVTLGPHLAHQLCTLDILPQNPTLPSAASANTPRAPERPGKVIPVISLITKHPAQPRSSVRAASSHWVRCQRPLRLGHGQHCAQSPHREHRGTPNPSWGHPTPHPIQMLSCSSNAPLPRAASLPGVLLPTEPVLNHSPGLVPFLGAGTPALRPVWAGGLWGWDKHHWEQGKGRGGQHGAEQLLRIPTRLVQPQQAQDGKVRDGLPPMRN